MTGKRSYDRRCTSLGRTMHWSRYSILFYKDSGDCRGDINGGVFISAGLYGNGVFVSFNSGFFYERRHPMDVSNQKIPIPFAPNAQRIIIPMADCFCVSACVFRNSQLLSYSGLSLLLQALFSLGSTL